jgi:hypothetical protein
VGARRGGEEILPFPGTRYPDLLEPEDEGDCHPEEVPCGRVVVTQPQRHLTNLFAATVLVGALAPLITEGALVHSGLFFDARRGFLAADAAIEDLDEVAA